MSKEMTSRERVLAAARRQQPDRVPRTIPIEEAVYKRLCEQLGVSNLGRAFKDDHYWVGPRPTHLSQEFGAYFSRPGVTWDEWGRGRIWDERHQYAEYLYPLQNAQTVAEILAYPWPDYAASYRFEGLQEDVSAAQRQGLAVVGGLQETIFEIAWQLRSFDILFEDIIAQDEKAQVVLDQITAQRVTAARSYALAGVDILSLGDDVAMQERLLMSPKMWRQWLRPRLAQVINAAREIKPDILIWYHSDGKINDLVPDLIEVGVDILNPVQPECVDHAWIKGAYGDRLTFCGGLGVQSVLPFGTPEQVREHVRQTITALGGGGGLIVGPSHVIEMDTPIENIFAMLSAIDEFGVYS
jgi:uroporphyrinogen decarboxylase